MLPIYAQLARRAMEWHAHSGLPGAAVTSAPEPVPAAATRRLIADRLVALADRVSPEPVERSRWQSG